MFEFLEAQVRKMCERKVVEDLVRWTGLTATMFGKFYEEILRAWLPSQGFEVMSGKPRVYWRKQPLPRKTLSANHEKLIKALRRLRKERSHCIPDGLLKRNNGYYIWEAKNWIQPFYPAPLRDRIWEWAWLIASRVTYRKEDYDLNGFVISWWSPEPDHENILNDLRQYIEPLTVDIFYTKDVLQFCMRQKSSWYLDIVQKKKLEVMAFFDELMENGRASLKS